MLMMITIKSSCIVININHIQEKPKWNFMQKYHHKGAFYMDTTSIKNKSDDVRVKNYASIPTLEDKVDKEKLPAILQVYTYWVQFGKQCVNVCIYIYTQ